MNKSVIEACSVHYKTCHYVLIIRILLNVFSNKCNLM